MGGQQYFICARDGNCGDQWADCAKEKPHMPMTFICYRRYRCYGRYRVGWERKGSDLSRLKNSGRLEVRERFTPRQVQLMHWRGSEDLGRRSWEQFHLTVSDLRGTSTLQSKGTGFCPLDFCISSGVSSFWSPHPIIVKFGLCCDLFYDNLNINLVNLRKHTTYRTVKQYMLVLIYLICAKVYNLLLIMLVYTVYAVVIF